MYSIRTHRHTTHYEEREKQSRRVIDQARKRGKIRTRVYTLRTMRVEKWWISSRYFFLFLQRQGKVTGAPSTLLLWWLLEGWSLLLHRVTLTSEKYRFMVLEMRILWNVWLLVEKYCFSSSYPFESSYISIIISNVCAWCLSTCNLFRSASDPYLLFILGFHIHTSLLMMWQNEKLRVSRIRFIIIRWSNMF